MRIKQIITLDNSVQTDEKRRHWQIMRSYLVGEKRIVDKTNDTQRRRGRQLAQVNGYNGAASAT